jgi:hypothetical protein
MVQPQQAGETVRCECGRENTVPTMCEIRRLQPAETTAAVVAPQWGKPQRLLLVGVVTIVLALILAVILYSLQYSFDLKIAAAIQSQRAHVQSLKPWETIQWYRRNVAPGFDTSDENRFQRYREMLAVGKAIAAIAVIAGAVLAGIGFMGLSKKKSG